MAWLERAYATAIATIEKASDEDLFATDLRTSAS